MDCVVGKVVPCIHSARVFTCTHHHRDAEKRSCIPYPFIRFTSKSFCAWTTPILAAIRPVDPTDFETSEN